MGKKVTVQERFFPSLYKALEEKRNCAIKKRREDEYEYFPLRVRIPLVLDYHIQAYISYYYEVVSEKQKKELERRARGLREANRKLRRLIDELETIRAAEEEIKAYFRGGLYMDEITEKYWDFFSKPKVAEREKKKAKLAKQIKKLRREIDELERRVNALYHLNLPPSLSDFCRKFLTSSTYFLSLNHTFFMKQLPPHLQEKVKELYNFKKRFEALLQNPPESDGGELNYDTYLSQQLKEMVKTAREILLHLQTQCFPTAGGKKLQLTSTTFYLHPEDILLLRRCKPKGLSYQDLILILLTTPISPATLFNIKLHYITKRETTPTINWLYYPNNLAERRVVGAIKKPITLKTQQIIHLWHKNANDPQIARWWRKRWFRWACKEFYKALLRDFNRQARRRELIDEFKLAREFLLEYTNGRYEGIPPTMFEAAIGSPQRLISTIYDLTGKRIPIKNIENYIHNLYHRYYNGKPPIPLYLVSDDRAAIFILREYQRYLLSKIAILDIKDEASWNEFREVVKRTYDKLASSGKEDAITLIAMQEKLQFLDDFKDTLVGKKPTPYLYEHPATMLKFAKPPPAEK